MEKSGDTLLEITVSELKTGFVSTSMHTPKKAERNNNDGGYSG